MTDRITQIESLCVNCMENGVTKLMLTSIPHFKEVIISSFECPHCGFRNREVQSGAKLGDRGIRVALTAQTMDDLDRQIIKSEFATILIPKLEFEIPPLTQKGVCNTLEGILTAAISDLSALQEQRRKVQPTTAAAVDTVIQTLKDMAKGKGFPFELILDDPSGNSHIEILGISIAEDSQLKVSYYERTKEQLNGMGFYAEGEIPQELTQQQQQQQKPSDHHKTAAISMDALPEKTLMAHGWDLSKSVEENIAAQAKTGDDEPEGISFQVGCPHCGRPGSQECCEIDIPGFRKCMIMAFKCEYCGSRSNEVKPMGAYGDQARKFILRVESAEDLSRDVLKADTAGIAIPEINLELCPGTLGGVFTTVEGLLIKIADQLEETSQFFTGDAADEEKRERFKAFMSQLNALPKNLPFTLILDDAADMSMISGRDTEHIFGTALNQRDREDAQLQCILYDRTAEQNDELGLTYMQTENYEKNVD